MRFPEGVHSAKYSRMYSNLVEQYWPIQEWYWWQLGTRDNDYKYVCSDQRLVDEELERVWWTP